MGNIINYFLELGGWSWLILGAALLLAEILIPGVFMLWVGVAAILTGLIALTVPVGIKLQLIIFAAAAIASVLIGRTLFTNSSDPSDQPLLNQRGAQMVGKTYRVTDAIEQGRGKIAAGDSRWSVIGPDAAVGTTVRVTGMDGNRLTVEPVE